MSSAKPSFLRRLSTLVVFRILPVILIGAILWLSAGIAQAVARRVTEQADVEGRRPFYESTAAYAAATLQTYTPSPTASPSPSPTASSTPSPTGTPTPSATATFTDTPSATPTAAATSTLTPEPSLTSTPQVVALAQIFATNTPRPLAITLPPLNTSAPPATIQPSPTWTPSETPAPTATLPPATTTPRPLPTLFAPGDPDPNLAAPTAIPTRVEPVDRRGNDLVNILLLGTDEEITNDNFKRTDTMIIVSINRTTNTVAMLSLPRDLYVYIPGWTMQRLNLAYARGEQVGWTDGGFGLMRQTLFYNLGINVHYYALVNLSGFTQIIDTLGGVDLAVDCAIQDYPLVGAPPPVQAQLASEDGLRTLPVGYYHLDGGGALWYARSRRNSSDFDRGRRQQQVLRAIWRTARDTGQLVKLPELWNQATQIVTTNLGLEDLLGLLPIALNLDTSRMKQFTLSRLYHTTPWTTPDGSNVQLPNYDTIRQLLEDFYRPPTANQVVVEGAQIRVFNGTANADWDRVAAERLAWSGFQAVAAGPADRTDYSDTLLTDFTGRTKGSSLAEIASILNVKPENIRVNPDPNRQADFDVILGANYNSCTFGGVLPVEGEQ